MILQASETLPSCLAKSRTPTRALIIFLLVVMNDTPCRSEAIFVCNSALVHKLTYRMNGDFFVRSDRVALGRYLPRAPTDPYVPALEHTVPQVMASLRA